MKRPNNTPRPNNRGIIFIAVMILLVMAGLMMLLMTKSSNHIGSQSQKMALDANLNNLQLSAMAWVKQNYPALNTNTTTDNQHTFTLDAAPLNIKKATIKGIATRIDDSHLKIKLIVACQRRQLSCKKTITYTYPNVSSKPAPPL
ncbi:MAG: hypothetical protein K9M57_04045 [Phycisphaerae bacterium]|nr:hypothetical protein [Phycisphaerae bacterium]